MNEAVEEDIQSTIRNILMSGEVFGQRLYPSGGSGAVPVGQEFQSASGAWYRVGEKGNFIKISKW